MGLLHHTVFRMPVPQNERKHPFRASRCRSLEKPRQAVRAAVKLDLQPFTLLPPPQVFMQTVAIYV